MFSLESSDCAGVQSWGARHLALKKSCRMTATQKGEACRLWRSPLVEAAATVVAVQATLFPLLAGGPLGCSDLLTQSSVGDHGFVQRQTKGFPKRRAVYRVKSIRALGVEKENLLSTTEEASASREPTGIAQTDSQRGLSAAGRSHLNESLLPKYLSSLPQMIPRKPTNVRFFEDRPQRSALSCSPVRYTLGDLMRNFQNDLGDLRVVAARQAEKAKSPCVRRVCSSPDLTGAERGFLQRQAGSCSGNQLQQVAAATAERSVGRPQTSGQLRTGDFPSQVQMALGKPRRWYTSLIPDRFLNFVMPSLRRKRLLRIAQRVVNDAPEPHSATDWKDYLKRHRSLLNVRSRTLGSVRPSLLHVALRSGHWEACEAMRVLGAQPTRTSMNISNTTPLMFLAQALRKPHCGQVDDPKAAEYHGEGMRKTVRWLLDAAEEQKKRGVQIDCGPDARNHLRRTALHIALEFKNESPAVLAFVEEMLKAGADAKAEDKRGLSPLYMARRHKLKKVLALMDRYGVFRLRQGSPDA